MSQQVVSWDSESAGYPPILHPDVNMSVAVLETEVIFPSVCLPATMSGTAPVRTSSPSIT